jgi:hypothetical protein
MLLVKEGKNNNAETVGDQEIIIGEGAIPGFIILFSDFCRAALEEYSQEHAAGIANTQKIVLFTL